MESSANMTVKENTVKEYCILTIGSIIVASAIYFFMIPSNVVMGSVTGLAILLTHFIPLAISTMNLLLNVICLILGFLFVGKEFGAKTVYVSILIPAVMRVYETLFPDFKSLTDDMLLDVICLIMIVSLGQALMFQTNASSGGLDIIAKILNKYFHIELGQALIIIGGLIIFSSAFVYDTKTLVVGALGTYFNGLVVDEYIGGFTRKKKVSVISDKYREIQHYISYDISRGVTLYPAKGGYSDKDFMELVTILDKNEYGKVMNYIKKTDPNAFITIGTVSEVVGMWNRTRRR